jgi:hypothetical protein
MLKRQLPDRKLARMIVQQQPTIQFARPSERRLMNHARKMITLFWNHQKNYTTAHKVSQVQ